MNIWPVIDMFIYPGPGSHVLLVFQKCISNGMNHSLKPWGLWCGRSKNLVLFGRATIHKMTYSSQCFVVNIVDLSFSGILLHEGFPENICNSWILPKYHSTWKLENHPQTPATFDRSGFFHMFSKKIGNWSPILKMFLFVCSSDGMVKK